MNDYEKLKHEVEITKAKIELLEAEEAFREVDLLGAGSDIVKASAYRLDYLLQRAPLFNPVYGLTLHSLDTPGVWPGEFFGDVEMALYGKYSDYATYIFTMTSVPGRFDKFLAKAEDFGFELVDLDDHRLERPFKIEHPTGVTLAITNKKLGTEAFERELNNDVGELFTWEGSYKVAGRIYDLMDDKMRDRFDGR